VRARRWQRPTSGRRRIEEWRPLPPPAPSGEGEGEGEGRGRCRVMGCWSHGGGEAISVGKEDVGSSVRPSAKARYVLCVCASTGFMLMDLHVSCDDGFRFVSFWS
jgi:hypothetical protein